MCTLEVPHCARSRSRTLSRARSRPRPRRADASFVLCLSLSRVRTRGIHARDSRTRFVSFHVISFVPGGGGRSPNGCARTSLARGDDADEDVSSLVWIVVSRRDARALEDIETEEEDDDAAGRRRRGRFSIRPERVADVRG